MTFAKVLIWNSALVLAASASDIEGVFSREALGDDAHAATSRCYDRFVSLTTTEAPRSWTETVRHPEFGEPSFADLVFGALTTYDWTDLMESSQAKR